jgi:HEPN domain-containing protein
MKEKFCMKDIKHAKKMLVKAKQDFNALLGMKEDSSFFNDEIFGFHAQQAVEKIIKAYLSINGVKFSKIHDIKELISMLKDNKINFPDRFSQFIILNPYFKSICS